MALGVSFGYAAPNVMSYQGQLNDSGGVPVNGSVSFVFAIYEVSSGGIPLWTETQTVPVSNGVFNVLLGSATALRSSLFEKDILYLGIKAGADQEMTPRQRITSAAYSQRAEGVVPIGSIVAWSKSLAGTPALRDGWVECNGQVLSDPESPYNGSAIPNLNGGSGTKRFLRGSSSSGATGGTSTHNHGGSTAVMTQGSQGIDANVSAQVARSNHTHPISVDDHTPPFYEVVWIIKVK